jgi:hypothetical protein
VMLARPGTRRSPGAHPECPRWPGAIPRMDVPFPAGHPSVPGARASERRHARQRRGGIGVAVGRGGADAGTGQTSRQVRDVRHVSLRRRDRTLAVTWS